MKICIVTETFPPEINGVAKTLNKVYQYLKQIGHSVSIVRPRKKGEDKNSIIPNETIVPSLPIPVYRGLNFGLPCRNRLRKLWQTEQPDIIYVATEGPLGLSAIDVALELEIAVTSGFHTNFHKYMRHYFLPGMAKIAERFLRKTHNRTLSTFAPTKEVMNQLNKMGVENTRLFGRGVDCDLYNPNKRSSELRHSLGAKSKNQIIAIFVSRIAAEKNIPLAIKAFNEIQSKYPDSICVFVGDGPEKVKLEKMYPNFKFVGMQTGEKLAAYYASGDLFVFPSATETFGNVITEAMASGIVPIAYNYAAAQELIDTKYNPFLAEYDNEEDFLIKVNLALEKRSTWPIISRAVRTKAETLNWIKIVENFAVELKKALIKHNIYKYPNEK